LDIEQLKTTIAKKLRAARGQRNLSQEDVAKQLGVTTGAYGSFERAKNLISVHHLISLSRIFQVPITDLLPPYVVSDFERNDPLLNPLLQEFISLWSDLPSAVQESLLNFVRVFLEARREKCRQ